MAKEMNVGVGGVSRVAKSGYMGVNGVAREFTGGKDLPIRRITLSNSVGYWHKIYYCDWKTGSIAETTLEKSQIVGVPKTMDIEVMAGGAIYVDSPYDYAGGIDVTPAEYVKASVQTDRASKRMIMIQ